MLLALFLSVKRPTIQLCEIVQFFLLSSVALQRNFWLVCLWLFSSPPAKKNSKLITDSQAYVYRLSIRFFLARMKPKICAFETVWPSKNLFSLQHITDESRSAFRPLARAALLIHMKQRMFTYSS